MHPRAPLPWTTSHRSGSVSSPEISPYEVKTLDLNQNANQGYQTEAQALPIQLTQVPAEGVGRNLAGGYQCGDERRKMGKSRNWCADLNDNVRTSKSGLRRSSSTHPHLHSCRPWRMWWHLDGCIQNEERGAEIQGETCGSSPRFWSAVTCGEVSGDHPRRGRAADGGRRQRAGK